jgi:mannosyltransferase OCH1-like enzyme
MNILQTWKTTSIPATCYPFVMKIRELNKNCNYGLFDDNNIIHFITNKFPEYLNTFLKFQYKIQQIDFFRYLVIYYYGGVYLDIDMEMTLPFDDLDLHKCVFPIEYKNSFYNGNDNNNSENNIGLIGNYAFYSPRLHPFIKHIIDNIVEPKISQADIDNYIANHPDSKEEAYVYYTTGPDLVTRCYYSYENKNEIILLEPEIFEESCFGKYGKHNSYGYWKSIENGLRTPLTIDNRTHNTSNG